MKDFLKNMRKKLKGRYPKNKKFEHQTSKIFFKKNYLKEWNIKIKHLGNYVWLTTHLTQTVSQSFIMMA